MIMQGRLPGFEGEPVSRELSDEGLRSAATAAWLDPDASDEVRHWADACLGLLARIEGYRATLERLTRPPSNRTAASDEAAASIRPVLSSLRRQILHAVERMGRACSDEVEADLHMRHTTVSARFNELARLGWIEPAGVTRARSGRRAVQWSVTAEGRRVLAA